MKLPVQDILALLLIASTVQSVNYCNLCKNHIACGNNGQFSSRCPNDAYVVALSSSNIQTALNAHNSARNIVASGGMSRLTTASKMNTLEWDSELAYLAKLNVKQCKLQHKGCIKTVEYKHAGQNLYWSGATSFKDINTELVKAVQSWFDEGKYVTQNDINQCCGGSRLGKIGHFLQLVQDRAVAVGCAVSRYTDRGWKATLIACNYSFGNVVNNRVYSGKSAASSCSYGRNPFYKSLCY